MEHDFSKWVYQKWEENCDEREAYSETHLTYEEYFKACKNFLSSEYIKEKDKERDGDI